MTRRPWAWPLVPFYAAAIAIKDKLFSGSARKLKWPVISVGSLSAGGAGKTPVVIALAAMLRDRGWHVDVLSRGYRREAGNDDFAMQVVPDAHDAAALYGDEPVLIAQRTEAPVWVAAERYDAGKSAENIGEGDVWTFDAASLPPNQGPVVVDVMAAPAGRCVHLLDDGFQHRQLARAIDIVLVTLEDLNDALLPAGNLREGMRALQRAHALVIREEEREDIEPRLQPLLGPGALVWSVHRRLRFPAPLGVLGAGLRPLAFCAIARPEGFAAMLAEQGCGVVETVAFADHHSYGDAEVDELLTVAERLNASGFITTEKDAVKLTPALRARLATVGPLMVVALDAGFLYPERVARELETRLA